LARTIAVVIVSVIGVIYCYHVDGINVTVAVSNKAVAKSIDCPFVGDVLGGVVETEPTCDVRVQGLSGLLHAQPKLFEGCGPFEVPRKLAMKICLGSSHEPIDPGARLLSQAHVESLRCSCNSCIALSLVPPLTVMAVKKSSIQILGSCSPLNLMVPSLILSPLSKGVVQM
jgi:hypothetical protein